VRAHDQRALLAVLVEKRRVERLGVVRLELEDVAELDRRLELERAAALGAAVAFARLAQVGEARLEVTARLNPAEVVVVAVRADDILALLERFVGDHLDRGADRADRAARRAERGPDLLFLGGPEI